MDLLAELMAIVALAVAAVALVWALLLQRRLDRQADRLEQLEVRLTTLQEQSRLELMAMGQRVMAADRLVNRFGERIDALETTHAPGERYGQLQGLSAQAAERNTPPSTAEAELAALLQRQQK